jgi:hypothetical protein
VYFLLVYVITAPEGDRIYDKKHTCFFCHKEYSKIARHLEQLHVEVEEVKTALKYDPNDPKRVEQFEKLCRMGNFNHNMKVLDINEGELKVVRRPPANAKVNPKDYLPCKFCHGFFLDNELWRHAPKCKFRNEETESSSKRMKYDGKFMLAAGQFPSGCTKLLSEKVVSKMACDSISLIVQSDETILKLGAQLLEKRGTEKATEVSQKMRLLGRVVQEGRKLVGTEVTLKELLKSRHFDRLIDCARNMAGFKENDGSSSKKSFKAPGTAVHCGYEIKRAAVIIRCQALREMDMKKKDEIDVFLQLFDAEWHNRVTTPALNNLSLKKHNKPDVLPLTDDLLAVRNYVVGRIAVLTEKVRKSATRDNWRELAEVTLSRMIMFNKRRGKYYHC